MSNDANAVFKKTRSVHAFTMVEMLTVIAIIAVLAALILPAVTGMQKVAKKAKAREHVSQLVTAWSAYNFDNRGFPSLGGLEEMYGDYHDEANPVRILAGEEKTGVSSYNATRAPYMEFTTNEVAKGFADVWGTLYQVALDSGQSAHDQSGDGPSGEGTWGTPSDGRVTPYVKTVEIEKDVTAWSKGPDKKDARAAEREDDLRSWRE